MRKNMWNRPPPRRLRYRWLALAAAGLLAALALVAFAYQSRAARLTGGAIADPPAPAADFALIDQFGRAQGLSGWRAKPVALTFIYTHCVDVCPLISAHLHQAYLLLGGRAAQIQMVAVTVDPEHDDVAQIRDFSDKLGLTDEWSFLTGSRAQLESVWASYGIYARKGGAPQAIQTVSSPEEIEHTAPVFLIDRQGQVRAMLPTDVTPDTLAADLAVLLAER